MIAVSLKMHVFFSCNLKYGEEKNEVFCILFSWQSRADVTDTISFNPNLPTSGCVLVKSDTNKEFDKR